MNRMLRNYYEIKTELSELQREEKVLKEQIHSEMNRRNSDEIITNEYICLRTERQNCHLKKADVPPEIWRRYACTGTYDVLTIRER